MKRKSIMDGIAVQTAELAQRERMILDWLAKPDCSEPMRRALEEALRRIRAERRTLMLRRLQADPGPL
jgi:hypothetical protein